MINNFRSLKKKTVSELTSYTKSTLADIWSPSVHSCWPQPLNVLTPQILGARWFFQPASLWKNEAEHWFGLCFAVYYLAFHAQSSSPNPECSLRSPSLLCNRYTSSLPSCRVVTGCSHLLFCIYHPQDRMEQVFLEQVFPVNSSAALSTINFCVIFNTINIFKNPTWKHILLHSPKVHDVFLNSLSMLQSKW